MADMDKRELELMKSTLYAMCNMPEKELKVLKMLTKGFDKLMSDEQKQLGRCKSRVVINSIIDDGFAEQDRLAALDNQDK